MTTTTLYAISSVVLLSALSLLGVFFLSVRKETLDKMVSYLVALAAGAMLGNGLFHLVPESFEHASSPSVAGLLIALGVVGCFLLEKWLNLRCHSKGQCGAHGTHEEQGHVHHDHKHKHFGGHGGTHRGEHIHPTGFMSLFSHTIHNFGDGAMIAVSYMLSPAAGLATTIAFILHEIPMELGEFGVLVNAGFKRKSAVIVNGLSGIVAIIGCVVTLILGAELPGLDTVLTPVGAGCVLYIATVGLMPQLQKETCAKKSKVQFAIMLAGIAVMFVVSQFAAH